MNQTNLQQLSQGFLDRLPLGIVLVDENGLLSYLNKSAVDMLEINLYELIDKPFWDLMRNEELLSTVADLKKGITNQASIPVDYKKKLLMLSVSTLDSPHLGHGAMIMCIEDQTQFRDIERIKRDFISVLLHRLRTPLTTVKSGLGFIAGPKAEGYNEDIQDVLKICSGETERMVVFLNDLRDLFLIEASMIQMSLDVRLVLVKPIIDEIIEMTQQRTQDKNIKIVLENNDPDAMVQVDPERLSQAVISVVNNAVNFTGLGGTVKLKIMTDNYFRLVITDDGIGIPPHELPHVFEKFFRGDNHVTREIPGYGLGLFIARYLIEQMGGRILAFSDSGTGSQFEIMLPL